MRIVFMGTPDFAAVCLEAVYNHPAAEVVGVLTRYHLLRPRRKKVVLVDHNEASQSVKGLEEAEILEIIDHHRLADIQTKNPIRVRNEPVGSTTTIVACMYQEKGLMPTTKMAGLMAAAIVSDTVMFKSPTCTQLDIDVANRMARIANISLEELGTAIFAASCGDDKSVDSMLRTDYKEFQIAGHNLAVSQITCMDSDRVLQRKEEFLSLMEEIRAIEQKAGDITGKLLISKRAHLILPTHRMLDAASEAAKGKGKIVITCPKCRSRIEGKS